MRLPATSQRLIASLLGVVLLSCSTTPQGATGIEEADLVRSVLLIQELPDGRVIHLWQRVDQFDLSRYKHLSHTELSPRRIVLAASWQRDCDEENSECIRKCMNRPLPRGFGHMTSGGRGKGGKASYCHDECLQAYNDCVELEKLRPQEFTAIDDALDWLKRNHKAVLVGSVIIIAGVAFVVVSAGTGLVILAPALLLTAPSSEAHLYMAEGSP